MQNDPMLSEHPNLSKHSSQKEFARIDIVENNAFRILGIYSNTPTKECMANINRIKRLTQVGKDVEFPMDLNEFLPKLERTEDLINTAYNLISLPEGKLITALFWFINATPVDDQAMALLQQGETKQAISLLETGSTFSSILNRGVIALIHGDTDKAFSNILKVIHDEKLRIAFEQAVCGSFFDIPEQNLSKLFVDELRRSNPLPDLFLLFKKNDESKNERDIIGGMIAEKAEEVVGKTISNFNASTQKTIDGTKQFVENCAPYLAAIRETKGKDNIQYRHLSTQVEKAALNVLVSRVNAAIRSFELEQSLHSKFGSSDSQFNALCNYIRRETLQKELVEAYSLMSCLTKLDIELTAKDRLEEQRQSLEQVMEKAGAFGSEIGFELKTEWDIFYDCSTKEDFQHYLKQFPSGYYEKEATALVEKFSKQEKDEIQRLSDQIATGAKIHDLLPLKDKCEKYGLSDAFEDKCFSLCSSKEDFRLYLQTFPDNAKYKKEAERHLKFELFVQKIKNAIVDNKGWWIAGVIVVSLSILLWCLAAVALMKALVCLFFMIALAGVGDVLDGGSNDKSTGCMFSIVSLLLAGLCYWGADKAEDKKFLKNAYHNVIEHPTEDNCKEFLEYYSDSKYKDEVLDIYYNLVEQGDIENLYLFANEYEKHPQGVKARERVEYLCDSLYKVAEKTATIEGWTDFRSKVPSDMYRDSQEKIDSISNALWGTDEKAWKSACNENTISAYQHYTNMYPHGKHRTQADKKIIDMEVSNVYSGDHGTLPSFDKISSGTGTSSKVTITNSSNLSLTILYSGPSSRRVVISPHQKQSLELPNGRYRVVASAPGTKSYACTENLNGGEYSAEYYTITSFSH